MIQFHSKYLLPQATQKIFVAVIEQICGWLNYSKPNIPLQVEPGVLGEPESVLKEEKEVERLLQRRKLMKDPRQEHS